LRWLLGLLIDGNSVSRVGSLEGTQVKWAAVGFNACATTTCNQVIKHPTTRTALRTLELGINIAHKSRHRDNAVSTRRSEAQTHQEALQATGTR
jgi:hypothetical protein